MVTDEMVEKAAEAYWMQAYGRHRKANKWPDDVYGSSQELFRDGCRAALEAALSTDAEPVAYGVFSKHGDFQFACVSKADAEKEGDWPGDSIRPLYAEPVKTAPAVAVKALQDAAKLTVQDAAFHLKKYRPHCLEALQAALSAQVQDVAVPEGWQLVPTEPTEEMHNAARDWAVKKYGLGIGFDGSDGCYRAMLAAAPVIQGKGE